MYLRCCADACWGLPPSLSLLSGLWKRPVAAVTLTFVLGILNVAPSGAQSVAERPEFEVASVKLNAGAGDVALIQALPGRLVMTNFSLRQLILSAYGLQDYQISRDPPWIGSEHYDIQAKAEGNASVKRMEGPMLQTLLKDRFKLMLHRETKQLPVYELSVAKGGVKLQHSKEGGCTPYSVDSSPPPSPAPGEPRPTFCGFPRFGIDGLNRTLEGAGVSIAGLATSLARSELRRSIIDRTGLTGTFDVHLKWAIDAPGGLAGPGISDDPGAALPPANLAGPSLFTALQDQLGLKLESAKGPVEVFVIDHVEKPSAN
jgi:uncharacterized protein (TIGR03435 family)